MSYYSPFKSANNLGLERFLEIFREAKELARTKISEEEVLKTFEDEDDIIIFFDSLMSDYIMLKHGISTREWKANAQSLDFFNSQPAEITSLLDIFQEVGDKLAAIQ